MGWEVSHLYWHRGFTYKGLSPRKLTPMLGVPRPTSQTLTASADVDVTLFQFEINGGSIT